MRTGHTDRQPDRRTVLRATGVLAVGGASVAFFGGCGGSSQEPTAGGLESVPPEATAAVAQAVTGKKVAVGQASFLPDVGIILARPAESTYVAYSDVCPHQGGKVSSLNAQGRLVCALHGSEFDLASGEAVVGPASGALASKPVKVSGSAVTIG